MRKAIRNSFALAGIFSLVILSTGCNTGTVFDASTEIPKEGWHYKNRVRFEPVIEDTTYTYDIVIHLRTSQDYPFSNLFLLIHSISPDNDTITRRKELTLALPDGKWLGKGKGPLVTFEIPVAENQRMKKGKYVFELEQNMRTNTLKEVVDIGIRLQKGEKYF